MMTVKLLLRWSKQMAPMRWDNSMMCAKIQSKLFNSCESHLSPVYRYYILDSNQKWRKYLSNSFKVLLNTFCLRLNRYKCYHAFSNIIIKLLTNEYVNMYLGQPLFPLKSLLVVCCPRGWRGKDFIDDFFMCQIYWQDKAFHCWLQFIYLCISRKFICLNDNIEHENEEAKTVSTCLTVLHCYRSSDNTAIF